MGTIHVDFGGSVKQTAVSKKRLADMLSCSTRWVELRTREGMPSTFEHGRRMYVLEECRAWIAENLPNARIGTEPTPPPSPRQGKRRTSAPRRPAEQRSADSTPAPARKGGDRSRAQAVAALEAAINGLQRQLDELRREPPPAA